jgi:hypothetical protein
MESEVDIGIIEVRVRKESVVWENQGVWRGETGRALAHVGYGLAGNMGSESSKHSRMVTDIMTMCLVASRCRKKELRRG